MTNRPARLGLHHTSRRWLALAAVMLTGLLTVTVIRVSQERGRLATYPRVDDVIYMARGAHLAQAAREGYQAGGVWKSVRAVAADWKREPPHSPWASGCAAIGYVCFGFEDWAAYVPTALPVLVFLLFAARLARRAGGRWKWRALVLVVLAASAPFLAASVYNLKPDYCAGILSAIGMMIGLRLPVLGAPWGRLARIGAFFGLALLAKPAMMAPTGLLCVGTLGVCVVRDVAVRGGAARQTGRVMGDAARACGVVLGTAMLVALPHYALAGLHAWSYSAHILAGEATDSWSLKGSWGQHAMYYLTGPGGHLMLDGWRSLATAGGLIGLSGVFVLARARRSGAGRRHRRMVYWVGCLAALGMAYLGPTVVPVKIAQFASAFSALLWLMAVDAGATLLGRSALRMDRVSPMLMRVAAMVAVVASLAVYRFTMPLAPARRDDPARVRQAQRADLVERLYRHVRDEARVMAAHKRGWVRVTVAGSPNELGYALLDLWGIRDGLELAPRENRRIPTPVVPGNTREILARRSVGDTELLIVGEPGSGLTRPKHETEGADVFYLDIARHHPDLVLVASEADAATGKVFEIYRRK